MTTWKDLRSRVTAAVRKVRPVTGAIERAANLAVHFRGGLTPMGAVGLVSAAVNALDSSAPCAPSSGYAVCCSMGTITTAMVAAGWTPAATDESGRWARLRKGAADASIHSDGSVYIDAWREVEAALDAFLPPALRVSHGGESWIDAPAEMRHYDTAHGAEIARLIRAHAVDGPRCVLLKGKPGTGKTTMAREIADRLEMGRVVFVDASAFGSGRRPGGLAGLRPAVIVVDDIDKIEAFGCEEVEQLRRVAPVVILTANNGDLDTVIDGAIVRPGRIDEVFAIEAAPFPREAPLDLLTDEEWDEARGWPPASVNELRRRLEIRGRAGMRFDDLRERLGRRVRSRKDVIA